MEKRWQSKDIVVDGHNVRLDVDVRPDGRQVIRVTSPCEALSQHNGQPRYPEHLLRQCRDELTRIREARSSRN